jgi:multiple antibiotic resistance protein
MVIMLVVAVALVLVMAVLSMGASEVILRILGRSGVSVVERIMGLLLSGMSVQFVYDGLGKLGLLSGGSL